MAVDFLRARRSKEKKFKMVSFRTVCRSIWNHPFMVAMLLFFICLHRYFPFLFSILVSASPVLVCTAVLLGALLIHGKPNDHKVEYRRGMGDTITSVRTERGSDFPSSVDTDGNFPKDRFAEVRKDIVENGMNVDWEFRNSEFSQGSKVHAGKLKAGFSFSDIKDRDVHIPKVQAQNLPEKYDQMSQVQDVASIGHQQKHIDDTSGDHESTGSESDAADKSSLDALVAGVISTPQETLPLLDCEDPHIPDPSHDLFPKSEMQSIGSNQSSGISDEETDDECDDKEDLHECPKNKVKGEESAIPKDQKIISGFNTSEIEKDEHLESLIARITDDSDEIDDIDVDDDEDDDEEEEEDEEENMDVEQGEGESVTMWTEEDEKNLRYLGSSELERNQRLENLLSRRRAQRNFSMISERNLIDLDRPDIPFQVAPISTNRVNPFDIPDNGNPGSAPSVTVPRKNPFESPCTSPKGEHNLTGENPKEAFLTNPSSTGDVVKPDFMETNRKEGMFRRYESFNPGYSFMGESSREHFMGIDRRDPVFSRHESFSTRFHFKPVFVPQQLNGEEVGHPSLERESIHDSDSTVSSESDTESSVGPTNHEEENVGPTDDHVSSHSEHGSESSKAEDLLHDDQDEGSLHNDHDLDASEANTYKKTDAVEENDSASSSSVSSEEEDKFPTTDEVEEEKVEEKGFSPKTSLEVSNVNDMSPDEDHNHVEPVYDTSPSGGEKKNILFPSDSA